MCEDNQTDVTEFLLLGFSRLHNIKFLLFFLFLVIFFVTIVGNLLIILLVAITNHLHLPMYIFLSQLSLSDLFLTVNIIPKLLLVLISNGSFISIRGCISQLYFFGVPTIFECFLLTSMSYDRFLAICKPLHYVSIMDFRLQIHLIIWPWFLGFTMSLVPVIAVGSFQFCGSNAIDHFFCDLAPLLKLSCSDISVLEMEMLILSIPILPLPFLFIIVTYVCISLSIFRISSTTGRQKAFSTCSSHLIVVCLYYGTLLSHYLVPSGGHRSNINTILSLLYTVITPLCNPIIYSLRNMDIKVALRDFMSSVRTLVVV